MGRGKGCRREETGAEGGREWQRQKEGQTDSNKEEEMAERKYTERLDEGTNDEYNFDKEKKIVIKETRLRLDL